MKQFFRFFSAGLIFALLLPLAACGTPTGKPAEPSAPSGDSGEASESPSPVDSEPHDLVLAILNENSTAPTEPAEPGEDFREAMVALSLTLLRKMAAEKPEDGRLVSALSIATALSMTAGGAKGETLSQMEALLSELSLDEYCAQLAGYYASLPSDKDASFKSANAIFLSALPGFRVTEGFLAHTARYFNADIAKLDFDAPEAADAVNDWCAEHTDGMIPKLLDKSDLSANTRMLLLNALCFDALWESEYQKYACAEEPFHGVNGVRTVTMLHNDESVYLEGENETGFLKPYRGGRYAFLALLPKSETVSLPDYLETLTAERYLALYGERRSCTVRTGIPKFKTDDSVTLNEILQSLGMVDAFDPSAADFTGMTGSDGLYIGKVLHKTHLELDESGTRAAAVTSVQMLAKGCFIDPDQVKEVILDRPFVYGIVDTATGLPIFMGTMN